MLNILLGLFGKKKDTFYAEIKEDDTKIAPEPAVLETVVEETVVVEEKAEAPTPSAPKTSKKRPSAKGKKKTTTASVASRKVAIAPQPFWVKAMENTRNYIKSEGKSGEATFATDYLLPQPKSRRRPGPSLNPFLSMARQVGSRGKI